MTAKKANKKQETIEGLLEIRDWAEKMLENLCPPCPACCPDGQPEWPCSPGEIVVSVGEIGPCARCNGRGYLDPRIQD